MSAFKATRVPCRSLEDFLPDRVATKDHSLSSPIPSSIFKMKIQAFMLVAALLFFSALVQDCEGIGIFPPGKGKRTFQTNVSIAKLTKSFSG